MSKNIHFTHVLVRTLGFQGYWGKGTNLREAIKNAEWINSQDDVQIIQCDKNTYIDEMGGIVYRKDIGYNVVGIGKVNQHRTAVMLRHVHVAPEGDPSNDEDTVEE